MEQAKAQKFTFWILFSGISIIFILILIFYFEDREPKIDKINQAIENQKLIEKIVRIAPRRGSPNADLRILEFGNFTCPSCNNIKPHLDRIMEEYPNRLQHIWFHTFDPTNALARQVATASECASQQGKFFEYHDKLFEDQENISTKLLNELAVGLDLNITVFQQCRASRDSAKLIEDYLSFGDLNLVDATPYLLINEEIISGEFEYETIKHLIENELGESTQ